MNQIDIIKRNVDQLESAVAPLDAMLTEMEDKKHPLHLTRIEDEIIKGRAHVRRGLELLKLRVVK